jgi:hypothetical protein
MRERMQLQTEHDPPGPTRHLTVCVAFFAIFPTAVLPLPCLPAPITPRFLARAQLGRSASKSSDAASHSSKCMIYFGPSWSGAPSTCSAPSTTTRTMQTQTQTQTRSCPTRCPATGRPGVTGWSHRRARHRHHHPRGQTSRQRGSPPALVDRLLRQWRGIDFSQSSPSLPSTSYPPRFFPPVQASPLPPPRSQTDATPPLARPAGEIEPGPDKTCTCRFFAPLRQPNRHSHHAGKPPLQMGLLLLLLPMLRGATRWFAEGVKTAMPMSQGAFTTLPLARLRTRITGTWPCQPDGRPVAMPHFGNRI